MGEFDWGHFGFFGFDPFQFLFKFFAEDWRDDNSIGEEDWGSRGWVGLGKSLRDGKLGLE